MPDFGSATFSQTDASNNSGTMPSWSGSAAPSTLDDAGRALQGAVTREWNWRSYTLTATGTSDAKVLTYSVAPAAYYNGQRFAFIANTTNTASATLNVNSLGAKTVKKDVSGTLTNLSASDMVSGMFVEVAYNTAGDCFVWVNQGGVSASTANTFTASQTINGGSLPQNSNTAYYPQNTLAHAGATAGSAPYYVLNRARGTYTSPTIVSSGDVTGTLLYQGYDGSAYRAISAIVGVVDGTPGAGDMPGRLTFLTTPDGSTSSVERMRIDSSGNVGIGTSTALGTYGKLRVGGTGYQALNVGSDDGSGVNMIVAANAATEGRVGTVTNHPFDFFTNGAAKARLDTSGNLLITSSGGLGYGTGSGGTVTQITNKNTGVTINKTNGQIVTAAGSITAGTPANFVVTNSTVAATDTIIVHRASGGTASAYTIGCDAVAAGSFRVYIDNITGGALNEVLTLNFAVIKAVTA